MSEARNRGGIEEVFALVGLIETSLHEHTLDQLDALLHPDLIAHGPVPIEPGAEAFKRSLASTRQAFPDMKISIEGGAVHDGLVFRQWTMSGTHSGLFLGIAPTGREIALSGVDVERLVEGRIVERWSHWDRLSLLEQLGMAAPNLLVQGSDAAADRNALVLEASIPVAGDPALA